MSFDQHRGRPPSTSANRPASSARFAQTSQPKTVGDWERTLLAPSVATSSAAAAAAASAATGRPPSSSSSCLAPRAPSQKRLLFSSSTNTLPGSGRPASSSKAATLMTSVASTEHPPEEFVPPHLRPFMNADAYKAIMQKFEAQRQLFSSSVVCAEAAFREVVDATASTAATAMAQRQQEDERRRVMGSRPNPIRAAVACGLLKRLLPSPESSSAGHLLHELTSEMARAIFDVGDQEEEEEQEEVANARIGNTRKKRGQPLLDEEPFDQLMLRPLYFQQVSRTRDELYVARASCSKLIATIKKQSVILDQSIDRWQQMLVRRVFVAWHKHTIHNRVQTFDGRYRLLSRTKNRQALASHFTAWRFLTCSEARERRSTEVRVLKLEAARNATLAAKTEMELQSEITRLIEVNEALQSTIATLKEDVSEIAEQVEDERRRGDVAVHMGDRWREACLSIVSSMSTGRPGQQHRRSSDFVSSSSSRGIDNQQASSSKWFPELLLLPEEALPVAYDFDMSVLQNGCVDFSVADELGMVQASRVLDGNLFSLSHQQQQEQGSSSGGGGGRSSSPVVIKADIPPAVLQVPLASEYVYYNPDEAARNEKKQQAAGGGGAHKHQASGLDDDNDDDCGGSSNDDDDDGEGGGETFPDIPTTTFVDNNEDGSKSPSNLAETQQGRRRKKRVVRVHSPGVDDDSHGNGTASSSSSFSSSSMNNNPFRGLVVGMTRRAEEVVSTLTRATDFNATAVVRNLEEEGRRKKLSFMQQLAEAPPQVLLLSWVNSTCQQSPLVKRLLDTKNYHSDNTASSTSPSAGGGVRGGGASSGGGGGGGASSGGGSSTTVALDQHRSSSSRNATTTGHHKLHIRATAKSQKALQQEMQSVVSRCSLGNPAMLNAIIGSRPTLPAIDLPVRNCGVHFASGDVLLFLAEAMGAITLQSLRERYNVRELEHDDDDGDGSDGKKTKTTNSGGSVPASPLDSTLGGSSTVADDDGEGCKFSDDDDDDGNDDATPTSPTLFAALDGAEGMAAASSSKNPKRKRKSMRRSASALLKAAEKEQATVARQSAAAAMACHPIVGRILRARVDEVAAASGISNIAAAEHELCLDALFAILILEGSWEKVDLALRSLHNVFFDPMMTDQFLGMYRGKVMEGLAPTELRDFLCKLFSSYVDLGVNPAIGGSEFIAGLMTTAAAAAPDDASDDGHGDGGNDEDDVSSGGEKQKKNKGAMLNRRRAQRQRIKPLPLVVAPFSALAKEKRCFQEQSWLCRLSSSVAQELLVPPPFPSSLANSKPEIEDQLLHCVATRIARAEKWRDHWRFFASITTEKFRKEDSSDQLSDNAALSAETQRELLAISLTQESCLVAIVKRFEALSSIVEAVAEATAAASQFGRRGTLSGAMGGDDSLSSTSRRHASFSGAGGGGGGKSTASSASSPSSPMSQSLNLLAGARKRFTVSTDFIMAQNRPKTRKLFWPTTRQITIDAIKKVLRDHDKKLRNVFYSYATRTVCSSVSGKNVSVGVHYGMTHSQFREFVVENNFHAKPVQTGLNKRALGALYDTLVTARVAARDAYTSARDSALLTMRARTSSMAQLRRGSSAHGGGGGGGDAGALGASSSNMLLSSSALSPSSSSNNASSSFAAASLSDVNFPAGAERDDFDLPPGQLSMGDFTAIVAFIGCSCAFADVKKAFDSHLITAHLNAVCSALKMRSSSRRVQKDAFQQSVDAFDVQHVFETNNTALRRAFMKAAAADGDPEMSLDEFMFVMRTTRLQVVVGADKCRDIFARFAGGAEGSLLYRDFLDVIAVLAQYIDPSPFAPLSEKIDKLLQGPIADRSLPGILSSLGVKTSH